MIERRKFLQLFGVGVAVIPVIGGAPVLGAEAKLIEVPKIEPVENPTLGDVIGLDYEGPMDITVILRSPVDGKRTTLQGKTFVMKVDYDLQDVVSGYKAALRHSFIRHQKLTWRMEGEFIPNQNGVALHRSDL